MLMLFSCAQKSADNSTMNKDQTPLPFGLTLDSDPDFKGGYTIREADGFALIGKGVAYRDIELKVEKLVGYGVQEAALAAEVLDDAGQTKFIKVVEAGSPSKQPFLVSWAKEADVKGNAAFEWVDLKDMEE